MSFEVDLTKVDRRFWQMIGEARSKCRHLMFTPLKPAVAREMEAIYLAKGIQATTAIEGNTLTLEQVRAAVEGTLKLPRSQEYLKQEVDNVLEACRFIERSIADAGEFQITVTLLQDLNRHVLGDLDTEDYVAPGEFRDVRVGVGRYVAAPPRDVEYLTSLLCEWLNSDYFDTPVEDHGDAFLRAFLKAVVAHVYIAWIHPFGDGNGRTARVVEFGVLTAAGIPSVAAHVLSNHYNLTRSAYYRQLDRASRSGGDLGPFLYYAAEGLVDLVQEQLNRVHHEVFTYAWENLVHETYRNKSTPAGKRQRELLIALGRADGPVPRDEIKDLTPGLAAAYASKQAKTITRDINAIVDTGLAQRVPGGIAALPEIMLSFTPRMGGMGNVLVDAASIEEEDEFGA